MSLFSNEIIIDGAIPSANARLKWERTAESDVRAVKIKGKAMFLHSRKNGKYVLRYYRNYGGDFCDAMFVGEIFEYDEGRSQITGKVAVSDTVKRFALGLILGSLPLAFLFNVVLYYAVPTIEFLLNMSLTSSETSYNGIFTFAGAALLLITVGVMSLVIDKRKTEVVMDYLQKFLQEDNTDV